MKRPWKGTDKKDIWESDLADWLWWMKVREESRMTFRFLAWAIGVIFLWQTITVLCLIYLLEWKHLRSRNSEAQEFTEYWLRVRQLHIPFIPHNSPKRIILFFFFFFFYHLAKKKPVLEFSNIQMDALEFESKCACLTLEPDSCLDLNIKLLWIDSQIYPIWCGS